MCKELEEELKRGQEAVRAVVDHMHAMGAGAGQLQTEVDGKKYLVAVYAEGEFEDKLKCAEDEISHLRAELWRIMNKAGLSTAPRDAWYHLTAKEALKPKKENSDASQAETETGEQEQA